MDKELAAFKLIKDMFADLWDHPDVRVSDYKVRMRQIIDLKILEKKRGWKIWDQENKQMDLQGKAEEEHMHGLNTNLGSGCVNRRN